MFFYFIWIIFAIIFGIFGYKLCKQGNAWGVLLWFLSLWIIGLIIGIIMIYNYRTNQLTERLNKEKANNYNNYNNNNQNDQNNSDEI